MIYRSQDKTSIFCFGAGCSLGVDQWDGKFRIWGTRTGVEQCDLLGTYSNKDSAMMALETMYEAIGEAEKMDAPSDEAMQRKVRQSKICNSESIESLRGYLGLRLIHTLYRNGYLTIWDVDDTEDGTLLKIKGIGKKGLQEIREAVNRYAAEGGESQDG